MGEKSLKQTLKIHDNAIIALLLVMFLTGFLVNRALSIKYNNILSTNLYMNGYKNALEETYGLLEQQIYKNDVEENVLRNSITNLAKQSIEFSHSIGYEKLWRNTTDISQMTDTFIQETESVILLLQGKYFEAALPIFEECSRTYELILKAYDDCNRQLVAINDVEQKSAEKFSSIVIIIEIIVAVIILFMILKLIRGLVGRVVQPIEDLSKSVSATSLTQGSLSLLEEDKKGVKEVNDLTVSYNKFIVRINEQLEKINKNNELEKQLLEEEAKNLRAINLLRATEIKALQNRINPHFLFNSLNMIIGTAYIEGAEKTTDLMELLGSYLRYNLDKFEKMVVLHEEIENVSGYLKIQKIRMGDRFNYKVDVDPECEYANIPCLTLQPLVENSISHGLVNRMKGGIIRVNCQKVDNRVIIRIEDNGSGIEKKKLEKLNHIQLEDPLSEAKTDIESEEKRGNSIGVRNVISRLKLYYDNDVTINVESDGASFTLFTLNIPYLQEDKFE